MKNLRRSKGCEQCRNKSFSIDYNIVNKYFADHGCQLLSTEYVNIYDPVEFICSCGNRSEIDFERFRKVKRCLFCKPKKNVINLSGDKHYKWNTNREEVKYNSLFRRKCKAVLFNVLKSIKKVKNSKTEILLGYTTKELKDYVQSHPNWNDVKDKVWHLDHKFPIKAFLDYGITDIKLINSLDNLQPILEKDNLSKCDRYDKIEFENWLTSKNFLKKGEQ